MRRPTVLSVLATLVLASGCEKKPRAGGHARPPEPGPVAELPARPRPIPTPPVELPTTIWSVPRTPAPKPKPVAKPDPLANEPTISAGRGVLEDRPPTPLRHRDLVVDDLNALGDLETLPDAPFAARTRARH